MSSVPYIDSLTYKLYSTDVFISHIPVAHRENFGEILYSDLRKELKTINRIK